MAHAQTAILPPSLGQTGFFAALSRVAEEDLAGNRKDPFIGEAIEQRLEEIRLDPHIAIE